MKNEKIYKKQIFSTDKKSRRKRRKGEEKRVTLDKGNNQRSKRR